MLSAVENFGPVTGPSVVAHPYAHHHHNTYAIAAASAAGAAAAILPPSAPHTPTTPTHLSALQSHHHHQQLEQFQQQQHQKQHTQQQLQYEQHLGFFLAPPTISNIGGLPSPPLSSPSSIGTNHSNLKSLTGKYVELSHLQHMQQQQQQLQQKGPYSPQSVTDTSPNSKSSLSPQLEHRSMMPINEFTRPQPKQQRHNTAGSIHAIPLQQNNLSHTVNGDFKHNYNQLSTSNYSSGQSGPINLATTNSAATFSSPHSQLLRTQPPAEGSRPSSSSSVDIENDGSMSPVSIPVTQNQRKQTINSSNFAHKLAPYDPVSATDHNSATTAAAIVAAYQFNYTQLYSRTALYGTPVVFSSHNPSMASHGGAMHPHAPYLNALSGAAHPTGMTHQSNDTNALSAAYLKAIAAAGIFNPNATGATVSTQPTPANQGTSVLSKPNMRNPNSGSMLALAHSGPPNISTTVSSSSISSCNTTSSTPNDLRHKSHIKELKKDNLSMSTSPAITKLASGTYLNDKVNASPADTDADNFFKVPSGKEGSLKHRILTRPSNMDKSETCKTSSVMRTHNSTSNFRKGSYIELSSGVLRRVEDMRTEDFIQCAERSPYHQLAESTVVKINTKSAFAIVITFSYDKNRSKVDIEVASDHPFFVYGQGWASCNPEISLKAYGLKCQRLQVGDICISLTQRDPSTNTANKSMFSKASAGTPSSHINCDEVALTQNLTRDLQAENVPPNVTSNHLSVSMAPTTISQYPAVPNIPMHLLSSHLNVGHHPYADMSEMIAAYTAGAQIPEAMLRHHLSPKMNNFYVQQPPHLFHHTGQPNDISNDLKRNAQHLQLQRPSSIHNATQHYYESQRQPDTTGNEPIRRDHGENDEQDQPVDASMSRKRRWSAPESICDEEAECQPLRPLHMSAGPNAAVGYKTYITSTSGSTTTDNSVS